MLNEKSNSKSQQRLMGMVYAYKSGDLKLDTMPKSLGDKIKSIADGSKRKTGDKRKKTKGISLKSAKDYASTKHEGLPDKVKEGVVMKFGDFINETLSTIPKGKTNDVQILRSAIIAELDAINLYEQMADKSKDKRIKTLLLDIAKEEKTHIGEFETLLLEIDTEQSIENKKGQKEVKDLFKK